MLGTGRGLVAFTRVTQPFLLNITFKHVLYKHTPL